MPSNRTVSAAATNARLASRLQGRAPLFIQKPPRLMVRGSREAVLTALHHDRSAPDSDTEEAMQLVYQHRAVERRSESERIKRRADARAALPVRNQRPLVGAAATQPPETRPTPRFRLAHQVRP